MQTIQIQDSLYDELVKCGVDIQEELKKIVAKVLPKSDDAFRKNQLYFQKCLENIENGQDKLIDFDFELEKLDEVIDKAS
jgi:hypothetical protein